MDLSQLTDLLKLSSIPIIAALVGWATNWLAVQLTFYPVKFTGIPPIFGWQGIIPSKARKMAELCVDSVLSKLVTVSEIVEQKETKTNSDYKLRNITTRNEEQE